MAGKMSDELLLSYLLDPTATAEEAELMARAASDAARRENRAKPASTSRTGPAGASPSGDRGRTGTQPTHQCG